MSDAYSAVTSESVRLRRPSETGMIRPAAYEAQRRTNVAERANHSDRTSWRCPSGPPVSRTVAARSELVSGDSVVATVSGGAGILRRSELGSQGFPEANSPKFLEIPREFRSRDASRDAPRDAPT